MNWMAKWAGAFPPFVREAQGAHFFDVDGHRYIDFCLGDTGAMTGHSPFATVKAVEEQMRRGITLMLPGEDAIFVAEELQKRFSSLLAVCADRDGCEPFFDSTGAADYGSSQNSGLQLVLSRNGGRDVHHPGRRWHGRAEARKHWAAGESGGHHRSGGVQRSRCAWKQPWRGRRGVRAGRAGDDECRHRPSAAGISPGAAGTHAQAWHAAHHRRDPHHLRRAGRIHAGGKLDPDILVFGKAIGGGIPGAAYGFSQESRTRCRANRSSRIAT